eukprot:767375-Hanusia_phi.AAC.2
MVEEENAALRERVEELSSSLADRERRIAQFNEKYMCLQALFDEQQEEARRKETELNSQTEQLMNEITDLHGRRERREQEHAARCSFLEEQVLETRKLIDDNMEDRLHACELLAQIVAMIPQELQEQEEVDMDVRLQPPVSHQDALKRTLSSASTSFRILERKLSIPSPTPVFSRTMSSLPVSRPPLVSPKSSSPRVLQGSPRTLSRTTSMVLPARTEEGRVEESAQSSFLKGISPALLKEALAAARKGLSSAQQTREIAVAQESLRMQNMMLHWQEEKQRLEEMVNTRPSRSPRSFPPPPPCSFFPDPLLLLPIVFTRPRLLCCI